MENAAFNVFVLKFGRALSLRARTLLLLVGGETVCVGPALRFRRVSGTASDATPRGAVTTFSQNWLQIHPLSGVTGSVLRRQERATLLQLQLAGFRTFLTRFR